MNTSAPRSIRHGDLPNAMLAAACAILDEAGPHEVGLHETARRVGVSATAAYRYFPARRIFSPRSRRKVSGNLPPR